MNHVEHIAEQDRRNIVSETQTQIEAAAREHSRGTAKIRSAKAFGMPPSRVARMYEEVFPAETRDPTIHLDTQFTADDHEDIVVVKDIRSSMRAPSASLSSRRTSPILPDGGRLAGLSKLARVTRTIASRPQLVNGWSAQIADALVQALKPRGAMVVVEAEHMCMAMRRAGRYRLS